MALFSLTDASSEAATLVHLADLISECEAAWQLTENTNGTEAENTAATRRCITVGPALPADDGVEFGADELANLFCTFQLFAPIEGGGRIVRKSDGSFDRPDESNTFHLITRRHCRPSELKQRDDVYLHFLSRSGQLESELITTAETHSDCNPLDISIVRVQGPAFGARTTKGKQGEYLFVMHEITWGDAFGE